MDQTSLRGLDSHNQVPGDPTQSRLPDEEIRFGAILNGGVSLAVWMGGVSLELDRLSKARTSQAQAPATPPAEPALPVTKAYEMLLRLAGSTARVDVIAGTSAGGINGAALALGQVNRDADIGVLRDIWIDQGRIETLLRQPFKGDPTSLLRGDDFFLPQLNDALTRLAVPRNWLNAEQAPIDLTITTTVLGGNQSVTVDSMGQRLPQTLHAGRFRWQRLPASSVTGGTAEETDPFSQANLNRTAHRLALASRSTASFPFAFEPSFVPVNSPDHLEPAVGTALTRQQRLRPDMGAVVEGWGDRSTATRSRFVSDGGLLANTPTRAALEAVSSMPSAGPVRRVMLLIWPHAPGLGEDREAKEAEPPTVAGSLFPLLGALTGQGSRSYVESIEEHNRVSAGRRGTRTDLLMSLEPAGSPTKTREIAAAIFHQYRRLRLTRAGRDLAERLAGMGPHGRERSATLPPGWNFERARRSAEQAQVSWSLQDRAGRPKIPYVPDKWPPWQAPGPGGTPSSWGWGVSGALGVAETAGDVLRRLVFELRAGDEYDKAAAARGTVSAVQRALETSRALVDTPWDDPLLTTLEPDRTYWELRLAYYEDRMLGTATTAEIADLIDRVADSQAEKNREKVRAKLTAALALDPPSPVPPEYTLEELLREPVGTGRSDAGVHVARLVEVAVDALLKLRPILERYSDLPRARPELVAWHRCLFDALPPADQDATEEQRHLQRAELLTRLLNVEVVTTSLGDEVTTGAVLPVELAQISAQTENAFTRYTRSADDKLGGMAVQRFSGFLKRSWRVNDWMWGRVDAATMLCRIVLHPDRVRRTAVLSGYLDDGKNLTHGDLEKFIELRAGATVAEVIQLLGESARDPLVDPLRTTAIAELVTVFQAAMREVVPDHSADVGVDLEVDLPAALPALADLFAWARHRDIVAEEFPALAKAIRADRVEGSNQRSHGEVFLSQHESLITALESGDLTNRPNARREALEAFDRAGIGREPLQSEVSSDLMIRTATTAAAVAASVVDSGRSGLSAAKPVTKLLRGAMLLPYWVVSGLSSRSILARSLSLLALAVGGTLLALALFGSLPEGLAGPAAALGGSAVLVAFAYAAMRTGTLLHGVVLLTPVIPLLTYSFQAETNTADASSSDSALAGGTTLLAVVALALGLMVLGSLRVASGSVTSASNRLADRHGLQPEAETKWRAWLGRHRRVRRPAAVLLTLLPVVMLAALAGGLAAVVTWLYRPKLATYLRDGTWGFSEPDWLWDWLPDLASRWVSLLALGMLALGIGFYVAERGGRALQLVIPGATSQTADGSTTVVDWTYEPVADPRGVAAGWSVLYGVGYAALSAFLIWNPLGWHEAGWQSTTLLTTLLLALLLLVVVPLLLPLLAYRKLTQREIDVVSVPGASVPWYQAGDNDTGHLAYAEDLAVRNAAYRRWVLAEDPPLKLRPAGERLFRTVRTAREKVAASADQPGEQTDDVATGA